MRRHRGSSPADITGSCRLPIKKRPYIATQENVGPSSNKVKKHVRAKRLRAVCANAQYNHSLCKLLVLRYHKTNKGPANVTIYARFKISPEAKVLMGKDQLL